MIATIVFASCAPVLRLRRAFAPEQYVTPRTPVGQLATVTVEPGFKNLPPGPYAPEVGFVQYGVEWLEPVALSNYARLDVVPLRPDATVWLYGRHTGLVPHDFSRITARSGTVPGHLPTALRFEPTEPLGDHHFDVDIEDLQSVYSADQLEDGDLLMLEVRAPGAPTERYLFRTWTFGLRTRPGAGVLFRTPIPLVESQQQVLSPALALTLSLNYRAKTLRPGQSFFSEQLGLIGSIGVGSTVLQQHGFKNQINTAFRGVIVGAGINVLKSISIQVTQNVVAPFRNDVNSAPALALGFDAVQFARFAHNIGARLLREYPMAEERPDEPPPP